MEDDKPTGPTPEALALAEEAAAKDRELLADLKAMRKATKKVREAAHGPDEDDVLDTPVVEREPEPVLNRAQRRQQVKFYASVLAAGNKQKPYRDPTIVPRGARRRLKKGRTK